METNNTGQWLNFLKVIINDTRLNVWHLALLFALIQIAYLQNEHKKLRVSRSRLMAMSHINTLPTYHKYFKQLQDLGYIKYTPCYHPGYRSTVEFLVF
ncbi:hypothetical protein SAMN05444267_104820 [Chryseobacterium polytrichastri]|uniref:Uncharacterized protein n=1 Tax=Chryseobacterium polytrichastri TaxID=1302687 RepID=A0A1M7IUN4_9FLAO|nr:hypothetical protein SAMN05444267_104820 [Chryseobacterium polytrichastri]